MRSQAPAAEQLPEWLRSPLSRAPPAAEPQRQPLSPAELVLTRPPSRQAVGLNLPPAAPASAGALGSSSAGSRARRAAMAAHCSSPYSSGGDTPAARLVALLLQPAERAAAPQLLLHTSGQGPPDSATGPPASAVSQLGAALAAAPASGRYTPMPHVAPCSQGAAAASPAAGGRPAPAGSTAFAGAALHAAPASRSVSWAEGVLAAPASSGDILAEWRARRQRQAQPQVPQAGLQGSSLADKYSRFLSLRMQPPHSAAPGPQAAPEGHSRAAALPAHGALGRPPAAPAGSAIADLPGASPDDGDILARWRARRRQQQAQAGGGPRAEDLTPLLTLRLPGASERQAAEPAVRGRLTAGVERPASGTASSSQGVRQLSLPAPLCPPAPSCTLQPEQADVPPASILLELQPVAAACPSLGATTVPSADLGSSEAAIDMRPPARAVPAAEPELQPVQPECQPAEPAGEPSQPGSGSQPAELHQPAAAAADATVLALVLPAAPLAPQCSSPGSRQASRPPSAPSSGRATPMSALALSRCAHSICPVSLHVACATSHPCPGLLGFLTT